MAVPWKDLVPVARESCIVTINIVSPNGLGWKPDDAAAAEAPSSPVWWLPRAAPTSSFPAACSPLPLSTQPLSPILPVPHMALAFWAQLASWRGF